MTYIVPKVVIDQEFTQIPIFSQQPLAALIMGPNYDLFRYGVSTEKATTAVVNPDNTNGNSYISGSNIVYSYPNQPASSVVDQNYVKVFFDSIQAQYFPLAALGSTTSDYTVTKVANFSNRVLASLVVKTTTHSARDAKFSNRDVTAGDYCLVNGTISSTPTTRLTKVNAVYQSIIAAVNGSITANGGNTGANTAPTITSSASAFTGTKDIVYKITVTRTGVWSTGSNSNVCARVSITSSDTDSSPDTNVAQNASFAVGTAGVTIKFPTTSDTGLTAGDIWLVPMTAAKPGDANIIEFTDSISDLDASPITIDLYLPQTGVSIPKIRSISGGTVNWATTSTGITVDSGISTTDPGLVSSGVPVLLPITAASVYVQYRALLTTTSVAINSISDPTLVAANLGAVDPDNALAQGVYNALLNAAGVAVYYVGVSSDDLTGYNAALLLAKQSTAVYSIVPLTFDSTVQTAVDAHVQAMSTSAQAKWRIGWFSSPLVPSKLTYNVKPDTTNWTATVADDPLTTGTQYTLVTVAGATFITDGVRAGDSVLINFSTDPSGAIIYQTYTIAAVRTQTTLVTTTAIGQITSAIKVQIQRNYTTDEQVANLALIGSSYNDRRIRMVFPDTVKTAGVTQNGYLVAAALAGLRSGVVPHQGLTNIQVLGFDDLSKSVTTFNQDQLNVLAANGFWILTQSVVGAVPYTRHQLTTDTAGINFSEDTITTNVDSISYGLQAALAPYIGVYNINPVNVQLIQTAINNELRFRATNTFTVRAGNQLIGYSIDSISQNATFKDRIDVQITLIVPYPMNTISITLIV